MELIMSEPVVPRLVIRDTDTKALNPPAPFTNLVLTGLGHVAGHRPSN